LDSTDLPVSPRYLKTLKAQRGMTVVGQSRWNNTVLVRSQDSVALSRLSELEFVSHGECVWVSPDSIEKHLLRREVHDRFNPWDSVSQERYGAGKQQIEMVNGQRLHQTGFRGKGMMIAVLDGGFQNAHRIAPLYRADICDVHDFVCPETPDRAYFDDMPRLYFESDHGTRVLSAMAVNEPEVLVGTAPEASYWLIRCEDQQSEQPVEEDYWAMAAELADSAGVDVINSSLGYNDYDKPMKSLRLRDLDGQTTLISRTASMLAHKGMILVNSAGNTGMGPWKKICAPADANDILTVGALNREGKLAPFSSVGPTQDGRVKPDVMALGSPTVLINGRGDLMRDMGTSFATPVICGLVACLWQALPNKTALEIINLVRQTSSQHDEPDNIYGYGIPNFWRAYMVGKAELKN
jgi:subtilisin family serine protease